ncbi:DMT family transporter [Rhabdobacter roseus]|uniref:Transporter family-2 protein n=1 Tax=Rhabdobacter roseus TaxID=1655419 RepID=A0A840TCZ9_9BACT|nr:DMT family transporter [Rhabdobacter roseus]MBB5281956.1 transporter family-2 protein [Rhabdobacter roseus]
MYFFFLILAVLLGVSTAVQSGINYQLRISVGSPYVASLISFLGGFVALLLAFVVFNTGNLPSLDSFRQISWWKLTGGLFGAFYVLTVVFIVRDIGPATMLSLAVAGQLIASVVIDHFGLLGFAVQPMSLLRLLGVLLLILGVVLILKY